MDSLLRSLRLALTLLLGGGLLLGALPAAPAYAATLVVTTVADDTGGSAHNCLSGSGACTLRGALAAASTGDTITFSTTGTILLANGTLTLTKNVTIQGPGATLLAVDGHNAVEVFAVNSGVQATLTGLTIQHGTNFGISGGGGIFNAGTLTVINSTLSGNSGPVGTGGGAIFNRGTLTVINSTLSGNAANSIFLADGGGIYNSAGTVTVSNSTLSDN